MFEKFGKAATENIEEAAQTLKEAAPELGKELGDKIEKASENLKEAAKDQKIGLIAAAKLIKEGSITVAAIVMGGIIINTLLKK